MVNNAVLQFVDGVFLARESLESLDASLPASMLALIVTCFFQSVVAYSGTFVAQYYGACDVRGMRMSYRAGLLIAAASGVLAVALVPLGLRIAPLMSDNPAVVERASIYYEIMSFGAVALCGQMAAASYFTGRGKTRLVFWVNVLGNVANIVMDPILIFGMMGCPRLGMAGAAYWCWRGLWNETCAALAESRAEAARVYGRSWRRFYALVCLAERTLC